MSGIFRRIDKERRIIIPQEVCKQLNITPGEDSLKLVVNGHYIILNKVPKGECCLCHATGKAYLMYNDSKICLHCAQKIADALG